MKKELNGSVYYTDKEGKLVPEEIMLPQDIVRDDLVNELATRSLAMREEVRKTKAWMLDQIESYRRTVLTQFGIKGKAKGGSPAITLTSYDGRFRITIAGNTIVELNENIMAAKTLLDEYIEEQLSTSNASKGLKTLIDSAFKVKQGQMDVSSILALTRLDIRDEKFQQAVAIIKSSIVTRTTNPSLRVYTNKEGRYVYRDLNFSTLEPAEALDGGEEANG